MNPERPARRHPASAFPEIQGVRLVPPGVAATLVNLSATGVLVECATRLLPGTKLTVHVAGTFVPTPLDSHVVRCEVAGISADGSLRFHLGLAFDTRIALAQDLRAEAEAAQVAPVAPPELVAAAAAAEPAGPPVLRNRW